MTPNRFPRLARLVPVAALAALLSSAGTARAGWDNVFQVACFNCKREARETRSSYLPVQSTSQHTTRYEDTSYYESVTVMKPTVVSEPVDIRVRSYYFDPVTTYTTRSYKNAAGCVEQISVPRTSYVRKEECNTVTKYVERMKMVPTEVRRKVTERTPITTYVGPTTRSYSYECENCGLPPATPGSMGRAPSVEVIPSRPPAASIDERLPAQDLPLDRPLSRNRTANSPATPAAPKPKPFTGGSNSHTTGAASTLRGEVVQGDRATPRGGAKLVFLSASNYEEQVPVKADEFGGFTAQLAPGKWYVYVGNAAGRADRTAEVTVTASDAKPLTVVSR